MTPPPAPFQLILPKVFSFFMRFPQISFKSCLPLNELAALLTFYAKAMSTSEYHKVDQGGDEDFEPGSTKELTSCPSTELFFSPYPWMASTLSLICVIIAIFVHDYLGYRSSYAYGFKTEFGQNPYP